MLGLGGLGLSSCHRDFFTASGRIASDGGDLGRWERTPEGCTRAPFDGMPPGRTRSVATLLWRHGGDPVWRGRQPRDLHVDEPQRLELSGTGSDLHVGLQTVLLPGATSIELSQCRLLRLDTWERPAPIAEGRPTLSGHLRMDCAVRDARITADITFRGCSY